MAYSQKHQNKTLVPWFNSEEWVKVYNLIYSETSNIEDKTKALFVLQVWKKRMPRLFSGVEGTLLILEAFLLDESIPDNIARTFFATAVMRFLNLCAANGDRQGTFYYLAKKRNLPAWLVDIRHNIAHSHMIPTKKELQFALEYCLKWLKNEYWDVQKPKMQDFTIASSKSNTELENIIDVYCKLTVTNKLNQELIDKLHALKIKYKHMIKSEMQESLLALLVNDKFSEIQIVNAFITNGSIFNVTTDLDNFPNSFVKTWNGLIQYLYENKYLIRFIKCLHEKIINEGTDENLKRIASMWLNEIFKGFIQDNSEVDKSATLIFNCSLIDNYLHNELDAFKNDVMQSPNAYTFIYLKSLLIITGNATSIDTLESVIKNYTIAYKNIQPSQTDELYTAVDLRGLVTNNTMEYEEKYSGTDMGPIMIITNTEGKRWQTVINTSIFEGCPLGILPHQDRNKNPVLKF